MNRKIYSSKFAQDTYEALRTSSREGINQTPESIQKMDNILTPLIKKGQSIAHIYATHAEELACSKRTIYSYIDSGVFEVRNVDLRRKVIYKPRKRKTSISIKDRTFRKGRDYRDFLEYVEKNSPAFIVDGHCGREKGNEAVLPDNAFQELQSYADVPPIGTNPGRSQQGVRLPH